MKTKLFFRAFLILIIAAAIFFIYNKNSSLAQEKKIDSKLVKEMTEDFNLSYEKKFLLVLNAEYLSCSICKDNLVDVMEKINDKTDRKKTVIILEKPKSGKWTKRRLTYWLSKMKIDNEIKFDTTGIVKRYLPPQTSLLFKLGKNNQPVISQKLPMELRLLDNIIK